MLSGIPYYLSRRRLLGAVPEQMRAELAFSLYPDTSGPQDYLESAVELLLRPHQRGFSTRRRWFSHTGYT
jgi:hypothetical protein